jgi:hypothetical protein
MVPYAGPPLVTPFTVQVTLVLLVPVSDAAMGKVPLTATFGVDVVGLVIAIATPDEMVTLSEADFVESAWLVTVTLNVAGAGTAPGAS